MGKALLSKRRFLAGQRCHLRMWNQYHRRDDAMAASGFQSVLMQGGIQIEELAKARYPGGVAIARRGLGADAVQEKTLEVLYEQRAPAVFDAVFSFQDAFIRTDILEKNNEGAWNIIEVKSTTRVRQHHLTELALQLWVLRSLGVDVARVGLLTVNREYTYKGQELDLDRLFTLTDCTDELDERMDHAEQSVATLGPILQASEPPQVVVGTHCNRPFPCEFHHLCHDEKIAEPSHPLSLLPQLPGHLRNKYATAGIDDVRNIEDPQGLNSVQQRALRCIKSGEPEGSSQLRKLAAQVEYPVHHIDFESFMSAVPMYANSRPYDSIPFQWSNHIEFEDGSVKHEQFLWEHKSDPREPFTESLLASLGDKGTICIYSSYENVEISQMAKLFQQWREPLHALLKRTWDLMELLKSNFYHPDFRGSFSIKRVLPALAPHLRYDELEIGDGKAAMHEYLRSFELECENERQEIYQNLYTYCAMDTRALVEIRSYLKSWLANQPGA